MPEPTSNNEFPPKIDGSNSVFSQRVRILKHLKTKPATSIELRETLDILHPGARINELRDSGYKILTSMVNAQTGALRKHRVAQYSFISESNLSICSADSEAINKSPTRRKG